MKNLAITCYIVSSICFGMGFYLLFMKEKQRYRKRIVHEDQKDKKVQEDIQTETVLLKRKEDEYV